MAETASVEVIISAFTEAAESALDDVAGEATDVAASMQLLQGRADEAADELDDATTSAIGSSQAFSALTLSTNGLNFSLGTLSSTLSITLIPLLAALATTLAPLAATLATLTGGAVALAGAFGLVVGSGLLAFGERRAEQNRERLRLVRQSIAELERLRDKTGGLNDENRRLLRTLKEEEQTLEDQTSAMGGLQAAFADVVAEIKPMVVQFGQQFIPLIEDAVRALPTLVQDVLAAVGGMDQFKQALRDFGTAAMDAIPNAVESMMDLARRGLPVLRDFIGFLADEGPGAMRAMLRVTERLGPQFMNFLDALVEAAPDILEMGTIILEDLLPPLADLVRLTGEMANLFGNVWPATMSLAVRWTRAVWQAVAALFNTMTEGINNVIRTANQLPGVNFDLAPRLEISDRGLESRTVRDPESRQMTVDIRTNDPLLDEVLSAADARIEASRDRERRTLNRQNVGSSGGGQ